jgi:hypothetical protein
MATNEELMRRYSRAPWCDTCERPAVFHESFGMRHSSQDFPFGIPEHLDAENADGHEVTMQRWFDTPLYSAEG